MKKKIIIIGAGIAGLACGVYLRGSGFDVEIFEKNDKCGGLCTTTFKNGYGFESCLYWVFGTDPNNTLYKMWDELGVVCACDFIEFDEYMRLEYETGHSIGIYSNLNRLYEELSALSPADSKKLYGLLTDAKKMQKFSLPYEKPVGMWRLKEYAAFIKKTLPFLPLIFKYKNLRVCDYVNKLKNANLQNAFLDLLSFFPDYPMIMVLMIFASMDMGNACYPSGGSLFLAKAVENKLIELSLKNPVSYNSAIDKIITQNDRVAGVMAANGEIHCADYVVSCCDGYNTIFNMLGGRYGTRKLKRLYNKLPIFHSYMQISFGVNRDMSDEMQFIVYKFKDPIKIGERETDIIRIRHYCFNNNFAPKGKSSLVVTFDSDYNYWDQLYTNDIMKYNSEKERVMHEVLAVLRKRFKWIGDQIEMIDIATPKTFERFTGNRNGSAEGWGVSCKTLTTLFPYTLKGLDNFYMAGHWTNINGGIMTASVTARQVAQLICNKEKMPFWSDKN